MKYLIAFDSNAFEFFKTLFRIIAKINSGEQIVIQTLKNGSFKLFSVSKNDASKSQTMSFYITIPSEEVLEKDKKTDIEMKEDSVLMTIKSDEFKIFATKLSKQSSENAFFTISKNEGSVNLLVLFKVFSTFYGKTKYLRNLCKRKT